MSEHMNAYGLTQLCVLWWVYTGLHSNTTQWFNWWFLKLSHQSNKEILLKLQLLQVNEFPWDWKQRWVYGQSYHYTSSSAGIRFWSATPDIYLPSFQIWGSDFNSQPNSSLIHSTLPFSWNTKVCEALKLCEPSLTHCELNTPLHTWTESIFKFGIKSLSRIVTLSLMRSVLRRFRSWISASRPVSSLIFFLRQFCAATYKHFNCYSLRPI